MKRSVLFMLLLSSLFADQTDSDFTEKFEKKSVYGKWIDIDSGKITEINSHTKFSFERLDEDLIIIKKESSKSYLKRIGTSNTQLSGRVVADAEGKGLLPAKNVTLMISNLRDSSIQAKVRTNKEGYFTNESLPSGDYRISCSDQKLFFKTTVSLLRKDEALGTFVLKPKSSTNFQSTLHLEGNYIISNRQSFKATVEIKNYGDKQGTVCYSANISDPKLLKLDLKGSCKTIAANKTIIVPLSISFNPISESNVRKVLNINMTDSSGRESVESHPFMLYRDLFDLKLTTALKSIKAYVILPSQELIEVKPGQKSVALPKLSTLEYQIIIANTDARNATAYEVDIGAEEKLTQETKSKVASASLEEAKNSTFRLKQSIGRYPDLGDVAIYAFSVADSIVMNEDDPTLRMPFALRNHLGDLIDYELTLSNPAIAQASYSKGFITVTPKRDAHGVATITLRNKSGATFGDKNIKLFTLLINSVNDKPVISSKPILSVVEDDNYHYVLLGHDLESRLLKKSAVKLPQWLSFSEKKGLLYGKPAAKDIGRHEVILALSDEEESTLQRFSINVTPKAKSEVPVYASYAAKEDASLEGSIKTRSVEDAVTHFLLAKGAANGKVLVNDDGTFTYSPDENFNGTDTFTVNHDVNGTITPLLISVNVESINDAPTAEDIILSDVGSVAHRISWEKASKAKDIDEDDLFLEIKSRSALGRLTLSQGDLIYTPDPNKQGSEKILLEISDKHGGTKLLWLYLYNIERGITPKVLKTGQTIIFHAFDDGVYKKSIPRAYEKDLQGQVVKDMISLKTWHQEKGAKQRTFADAKEFCDELEIEGVEKWRLPTIEELVMISDKGRTDPAVDPIFEGVKSTYYWSNSPYKNREDSRWVLYFDYGEDYYRHESSELYTLCVHNGVDDLHPPVEVNPDDSNRTYVLSTQTSASAADANQSLSSFSRDGKLGVVIDKKSELMWYDGKLSIASSWISAISYCEEMVYAGFTNWRVPNFNELYLTASHEANGTATLSSFRNVKEEDFWTSTSSEYDHDRAWGISFVKGSDFTFDKSEQLYTRCVRDLK